MKKIKYLIVAILIFCLGVYPINIKSHSIAECFVAESSEKNFYLVYLRTSNSLSSYLYADFEYSESECEIHIKGAISFLSRLFGSQKLPVQINAPNKNGEIEKVYLICSDERILIYEKKTE